MRSTTRRQFRVLSWLLLTFGCASAVYFLLRGYFSRNLEKSILDFVILKPGSAEFAYKRFESSSNAGDSTFTSFYFFNITNLNDVRIEGAKPVLEELGPYTYRTSIEKHDIVFHWNGSVSFRERILYFPAPERTKGSFDDRIVTLNFALIGVLDVIYGKEKYQDLEDFIINAVTNTTTLDVEMGLFQSRSVEELLWGYDDSIIETASKFLDLESRVTLVTNGSYGNEQESNAPLSIMNTGVWEVEQTGQFEQWIGLSQVRNENTVASVKGTDGSFFQPFLTGNENLSVWIPEMARSMPIRKETNGESVGFSAIRFTTDPSFWRISPKSSARHQDLIRAAKSSLTSLLYSPPHFCGLDPSLMNYVVGLNCDEERDSYIDVEPNTGISLESAMRFMVSSEFSSMFSVLEPNLKYTVLPIFWHETLRVVSNTQREAMQTQVFDSMEQNDTIDSFVLFSTVVMGIVIIGFILRMIGTCLKLQNRRAHIRMYETDRLLAYAL